MMFVEMLNQCLPTNQIMLCDNLLALCGITITWLVALCFPRKVFSNSLHRHTHWGWAELEVRLRNNTHIHENAHDYLHTIVTKNYIYTNVRITNLCTYITWWRRYFSIPRLYNYSLMGMRTAAWPSGFDAQLWRKPPGFDPQPPCVSHLGTGI
jgi:hypothetical protein